MHLHYYPSKANVVGYSLSRIRMGSTAHDEDKKNEFSK